jgi:hypothetical protein
VRRLSGSYERWGDYFGIQSVPGHPNQVFTAGFYGTSLNSSSTWFNRLEVTDNIEMTVSHTFEQDPYITSSATISVDAQGGFIPYSYHWSDGSTESTNTVSLQTETGVAVNVSDSKGCTINTSISSPSPQFGETPLFPNPVTDQFSIGFSVSSNTVGKFRIYDMVGKLIVNLGDLNILEGANSFTFSTRPLLKGSYVITIMDAEDNKITQQSFIKL